jgi:hypothetical protein
MGAGFFISVLALVLSAAAVGISLYQAWLSGPRIRASVSGPVNVYSGGKKESGPHITIAIFNRGTQPTTVTHAGLVKFEWATPLILLFYGKQSHALIFHDAYGVKLPTKLGPGEEVRLICNINESLRDEFLCNRNLYIQVSHSWSHRPMRTRVPSKIKSSCLSSNEGNEKSP